MGQRQPSSFLRSQLSRRVVVQRGNLRYPRRVPSRARLRSGFRGQGAGIRHRVLFVVFVLFLRGGSPASGAPGRGPIGFWKKVGDVVGDTSAAAWWLTMFCDW
ncbi:unnamed protein product [Ectocarpus sp. 12 AP-2014]